MASDGGAGQDLFSADPGRLGRDVACTLLGVDLAAAGVSGSATIQGGDTLVVTTTDTYQTTFLGIIGLNRLTVTGHASARIVRAVGGVER